MPGKLRGVLRSIYHRMFRSYVYALCGCARLTDWLRHPWPDGKPLPPPLLRYRVAETVSPEAFYRVGRQASRNLVRVLEQEGVSLRECRSILDFGCGCGRTLMWLAEELPDKELWGTDVDEEAIRWCRDHLERAGFLPNGPQPPLPFMGRSFDLVYALSVFTHLDEEAQRLWLAELKRVLTPGGVLLVTVHGSAVWSHLNRRMVERIRRKGHVETDASRLEGIYPGWYRTAFHTETHVRESFGAAFRVVRYVPEGMGHHDLVICSDRSN